MNCFSETVTVQERIIAFQGTKRIEIEPFVILNSFKLSCPLYCLCVCVCGMSEREEGGGERERDGLQKQSANIYDF